MIQGLVVFLVVGIAALGRAEEQGFDVNAFFQEVRRAQTTLNYRAEQRIYAVSLPRSILARFQVTCVSPHKKRERIDGSPQERVVFLEDGTHLWTYVPKRALVIKKSVQHETTDFLPCHFYDDVELIKKNYMIVAKGNFPSSNVMCQVLAFIPKHNNRHIREIWFERERKLPVRIYLYTREGRPSYLAELDNIEWNPRVDRDTFHLMVPPGTKVYEILEQGNLSLEEAQRLMQLPLVLPPRIPAGFCPFNILVRFEGDHRKAQVVYSDGLSSLSVFEERTPPARAVDGGTHGGTHGGTGAGQRTASMVSAGGSGETNNPFVSRYGLLNVLSCDLKGMRATLVGDIDENDLLDTVRSLAALE